MKNSEDIKRIFDEAGVETSPSKDEKIFENITAAYKQSNKAQPEKGELNIWRAIMKSPITKLAAAVGVIIAVFIGVEKFGASIDGVSTAFATMRKAVERMPVMHQVYYTNYGDGQEHHTERWYDFTSRTVMQKYYTNGSVFKISSLNYDTMKKMVYTPESNVVKIVYACDVIPGGIFADSAEEVVDNYIKGFESRGANVSHRRDVYDGQDAEVFQLTIESNEGENTELATLVVNRETNLPMAYEKQSIASKGNISFEQKIKFDFLTDTPKDIYDIGVPRSTKVIVDSVSEERYNQKVALLEEMPKLEQAFNEIYHLDETEVLVHIGPNDVATRLKLEQTEREIQALSDEQYLERIAKESSTTEVQFTAFEWSDGINRYTSRPLFYGGTSVKEFLERIIGLSMFEYDIPESILNIKIPGDWVMKKRTQTDQLLSAFEKILAVYTELPVHFKQIKVERDVIVARGTFKFRPLSGTYDNSWIHVFSDTLDSDESGGGVLNLSVDRFLRQRLAVKHLGQQVLNLANSTDEDKYNFGTHMSSYLRKVPQGPEREAKLAQLLKNLSYQTSLTFSREQLAVDVWYVEEIGKSAE